MGETREILARIGHPTRPRLPIVRTMAAVAVLVLLLNVLAVWRHPLRARCGAEGVGAERVGDIPPGGRVAARRDGRGPRSSRTMGVRAPNASPSAPAGSSGWGDGETVARVAGAILVDALMTRSDAPDTED